MMEFPNQTIFRLPYYLVDLFGDVGPVVCRGIKKSFKDLNGSSIKNVLKLWYGVTTLYRN